MAVALVLFSGSSSAQETNSSLYVPATKLESFETNIGVVIIKATTEIGRVSGNSGVVSVKARENSDTSSGRKERGVAIELGLRDARYRMLIDFDELGSLIKALDYLSKLDASVSSLDSFDAGYNTRGGFRVAVLGDRRSGSIQFGMRDLRFNMAPVVFSRNDITQFANLLEQAGKQLEALDQKQ